MTDPDPAEEQAGEKKPAAYTPTRLGGGIAWGLRSIADLADGSKRGAAVSAYLTAGLAGVGMSAETQQLIGRGLCYVGVWLQEGTW